MIRQGPPPFDEFRANVFAEMRALAKCAAKAIFANGLPVGDCEGLRPPRRRQPRVPALMPAPVIPELFS